jgi:hypothetical protein
MSGDEIDEFARQAVKASAAKSGQKGCYGGTGRSYNYYELFPEHSPSYHMMRLYLHGVARGQQR